MFNSKCLVFAKLFSIIGVVFFLNSCSLVRIESEQKPLEVIDLNTRLLTHEFVGHAMNVTQNASDSILKSKPNQKVQQLLLSWQINTAKQLKKFGFQPSPQVSMVDVWTYALKADNFFDTYKNENLNEQQQQIIKSATSDNLMRIQKIASSVKSKKDYIALSDFIEKQAAKSPFKTIDFDRMESVKDAYFKFKETPDDLAVETVGTLSEVVSNMGSKISYGSDLTRKQLQWETQLYLNEKGIDSIKIEQKIKEFQLQTERLINVAENAPELIDDALITFRQQMDPLFSGLNTSVSDAMLRLSEERLLIDGMIERERYAFDKMLQRERKILTEEAHTIVNDGVKNTMAELRSTIRTLALLGILFVIVILGLPFYAGYLLGKKKKK
ncbi:MAG: hypothetical protein ACTH5N_04760 [Psychroflexus halocasei]